MHLKICFSDMNSKTIQGQIEYQLTTVNNNLKYFKSSTIRNQKTFADEINTSLGNEPKSINPKFLYNENGSKLFDEICSLPEYYPYRTEVEILKNIQKKIKSYVFSELRLVELGSGSSVKTRLLLDALYNLQTNVEYIPIDISDILTHSTKELSKIYKDLKITGIIDTYENGLDFIKNHDTKPNLISFLGSSFGNFDHNEGMEFLQIIHGMMKDSDLFLIGFDLKKDPVTLHNAYNDSKGVTARFNLNVLDRINCELGADFDLTKFAHHAHYNESCGRIEMYLKSSSSQTVTIPGANLVIDLAKDELIHTENSYKFSISQIQSMFDKSGIKINKIWYDSRKYFILVLGQKSGSM